MAKVQLEGTGYMMTSTTLLSDMQKQLEQACEERDAALRFVSVVLERLSNEGLLSLSPQELNEWLAVMAKEAKDEA